MAESFFVKQARYGVDLKCKDIYRDNGHLSFHEILTLAPTTLISAVGNVELTVNEFKRLLSPNDQNSSNEPQFLNEEIIWTAITKFEPLPDHKHVLLPFHI